MTFKRPDPKRLEVYQADLLLNDEAMGYLHFRGLSEDTLKHFKIGYDQSKKAIVIPIFKRGELVNFKFRILNPTAAKYTQEKDAEVWLFNDDGIQRGFEKGGVLIVEGEFDCMSAWQAGFENTISPASGKDSYGVWIELLDAVPKVFIAYDNDEPGRGAAKKLAEKVGVEKCTEIIYPHGIKDANDFFKVKTSEDFRVLLKEGTPFYKHQFKGLGDVLAALRGGKKDSLELEFLPGVSMESDWLLTFTGKTNVGKTSYIMNLADELTKRDFPTLILPFERGPEVVGERFLQVKYGLNKGDFVTMPEEEWKLMSEQCISLPLYFAMPTRQETFDIIRRAKRIFDVKVVIIDHLDYMVGRSKDYWLDFGRVIQELKELAIELKVIMFVVNQPKKVDSPGAKFNKKIGMEDSKGPQQVIAVPECVVLLHGNNEGTIEVDVQKNKGPMTKTTFSFNVATGKLRKVDIHIAEAAQAVSDFDDYK